MRMKFFFWIPVTLFLLSCEKGVSIDLDDASGKLVVDATIENDRAPVVILSKSLGYFSQIDASILSNSFVRDAVVAVSNGTLTHTLKEYSLDLGNGNTLYYYSIDSGNLATAFLGELEKDYTLLITWEGRQYRSQTRIPATTRQIDSLFWRPAPAGNEPDQVSLVVRARDRAGLGDYIRYFTKRNSEPFYPGITSVFDDQVIDGASYEIEVERGANRNEEIEDGYNFFRRGDTITLKLCNIDKATYDFWRTMEFSYASIGNPFSTPTRILGNIDNGALGYFGGYACQYRKLVIPR
ncbi:MAG: DUF4249 domain-containing protein [Chitinophagaceae bacterium]|nr:DUF4249 domain-containing protein [Chitinophagaceae bacterium]